MHFSNWRILAPDASKVQRVSPIAKKEVELARFSAPPTIAKKDIEPRRIRALTIAKKEVEPRWRFSAPQLSPRRGYWFRQGGDSARLDHRFQEGSFELGRSDSARPQPSPRRKLSQGGDS
ncbi:hypothetical protein AVEN_31258-1 [Araneus ventricosus]|uniref:Uncharacterized protein n=1 Tax=Araneus ventricosus TaxID=182803 RepID=A0A4Y2IJX0_ARAVE|nr:hypothetical protein AVEN_31258-1 [Araneus ventricosus]